MTGKRCGFANGAGSPGERMSEAHDEMARSLQRLRLASPFTGERMSEAHDEMARSLQRLRLASPFAIAVPRSFKSGGGGKDSNLRYGFPYAHRSA
jgi:hypothetical protein